MKKRSRTSADRGPDSRSRNSGGRPADARGRPSDRRPSEARRGPRREPDRPTQNDKPLSFGVLPVLEALRGKSRRIDKILIAEGAREHRLQEIIDLARENDLRIDRVSRESLDRLVGPSVNHQGVVAFAAAADYASVDEILAQGDSPSLIVVLDGVEDPRNLGAILRSVECAAADGVIIPERRAVGLTDVVAKASAGAIEYVKVAKVTNLNRLIEDLKERQIWVVGTSADATTDYTDWDWNQPTALVLGAEGHGLHRLVAENCDALVKVPMYGKIDSLNVSVATGVILFEARRQRSRKD